MLQTRILNSLAICLLILATAYKSHAQEIPNGDFEEWLTCLCDPPNWVTSNIYPPPLYIITKLELEFNQLLYFFK